MVLQSQNCTTVVVPVGEHGLISRLVPGDGVGSSLKGDSSYLRLPQMETDIPD